MTDTVIDITPEEKRKVRAICKIFNAQKTWIIEKGTTLQFIQRQNTSQQLSKE